MKKPAAPEPGKLNMARDYRDFRSRLFHGTALADAFKEVYARAFLRGVKRGLGAVP